MTTLPDSHADLLANPGVTALSTIGPDGYPQVTAIWFLRETTIRARPSFAAC